MQDLLVLDPAALALQAVDVLGRLGLGEVRRQLLAGLAVKLVEVGRGEGDPVTQATLGGDIATFCATFDALVAAARRRRPDARPVALPGSDLIEPALRLA